MNDQTGITFLRYSLLGMLIGMLSGCASMIAGDLVRDLQKGIMNQDDPAIVMAGAPAYMLIIDGKIQSQPNDRELLIAGARLYGTYSSIFVQDKARAKLLSARARDYAQQAICLVREELCETGQNGFDRFVAVINTLQKADIDMLYTYATTWAGWVLANNEDWNAIADLPKIEAMMKRIVALDENYEHGQAHVYLGVLQTRLPASMGGKPEQGRAHFERAISLSAGRNLIAKVELARRYARLVFDRKLHDRLLNEVLETDPKLPGLTLSNVLAQQQARQLLESATEYF
ncbi:TRAP transporter TatT component family protein [Sulfuriflexus mobilis]|uniref:TRAP transporter TatT component family protein n=1 Tax=Sulfuriflexus mobilis TaxID=1811807 RepID=UPI0018D57695|nr:TRAP transporter TatT component family protein [Sulfuriflexus mobilis]